MVTGALGVIWGLDAPYEATVHPGSNGFRAKKTFIAFLESWYLKTSTIAKKKVWCGLKKKVIFIAKMYFGALFF